MGINVTITGTHIAHAGRLPLIGWPGDHVFFSMGRPEEFPAGPVTPSGSSRNLPDGRGWLRGGNMDPLTRASAVAGSVPTEPYILRLPSVDYEMERRS